MDKLNREAREVYLYASKEILKLAEGLMYHSERTVGNLPAYKFKGVVIAHLGDIISKVARFQTIPEKRNQKGLKRLPRLAKPKPKKKKAKRR